MNKENNLTDYFHHLRPIKLILAENTPYLNLAIPYLAREESIFAGTRMILALGAVLIKSGLKVRFVVTDEIWDSKGEMTAKENFYKYFPDCSHFNFEVISVALDENRRLEISEYDIFIASAWWTVYAWDLLFTVSGIRYNKLFYLIQDFEPGFYPWGSDYSFAMETYSKDIIPIYSTESLRTYFEKVIKIRPETELSAIYQPEISKDTFYPADINFYSSKRKYKVFCYCRPSIPRNMHRLLVEALKACIRNDLFLEDSWEFLSGGENHPNINLGQGFELKSLGKMSYSEYGEFLRTCDIGLSLMYSPHPSYPPFEMAQSGLITVTNSFPGKDLSILSGNIISCDSTVQSLVNGIKKAIELSKNYEWRIKNAPLSFPNAYEECFQEAKELIIKTFNENKK